MPTQTTSWRHVSDGDTTTHNPADEIGSENIDLLNVEIRWRGEETQDSSTSYKQNSGSVTTGYVERRSIPSLNSRQEFSHHHYRFSSPNWEAMYHNAAGISKTLTGNPSTHTINEYHGGSSAAMWHNPKTDTGTTDYRLRTYYYQTYVTEDPSISGDFSATYWGYLSGGETSNWQNVSGISVDGDQAITHSISDYGQADYQIRYEYEYNVPNAISEERVEINGTTYSVILADPDDPVLEYNFYRTEVPGKGILAYDVVDPSNPDALPLFIYHPIHGKLAFRAVE